MKKILLALSLGYIFLSLQGVWGLHQSQEVVRLSNKPPLPTPPGPTYLAAFFLLTGLVGLIVFFNKSLPEKIVTRVVVVEVAIIILLVLLAYIIFPLLIALSYKYGF